MSPTPRKARSGRKQFGPSPGTEQEWAQVMESPHVKRAFADPAIQQALMQHMEQQAAAAGPAAPEAPVGMAHGGAAHFDSGGLNATELQNLMREIEALPEGEKKNSLRMRVAQMQTQQSQGAAALALPGGGNVSASTMGGLNQMVKPPTMGNTALAAGMGALMGAGTTSHQGLSALLGAGLSGGLSYLIRKYGKGAQAQQHPGDRPGGGVPDNPNVTTSSASDNPNTTASAAATTPGGTTEVAPAEAWKKNAEQVTAHAPDKPSPTVTIPSEIPSGATPPGPASLMMGSGNSPSGNVISRDGGKTWSDRKTPDEPYKGVVLNQSQVDPGSSLNAAVPATTPPTPTPGVDPSDWGWGLGFAEGGPVEPVEQGPPQGLKSALVRRPMPVLHTTIVITGKPDKKPDKKKAAKKAGGVYPKTQLLPPKRGPQDHEDRPRTHGRVQVPRGSGAAIKGRRFGGIF